MNMTPISIENRWFKRTWTIDDDGIHEIRRDALPIRISWDEIESRTASTFSGGGKSIRIAVDPETRRPFMRAADDEWKTRHPQRHATNRRRMFKRLKIATFVFMPIILLGPAVGMWILVYLYHHFSLFERLPEVIDKATRITIVSAGMLVVFWTYVYIKIIRKHNKTEPALSPYSEPATRLPNR